MVFVFPWLTSLSVMSSRAVCSYVCVQSCLTLCDTMNCSLPGSSFHVIFQARVLKWVAISYSRGSSHPRDWTHISWIGRQIFYQLQHLGDPLGLWCCCKWHYFIHFYGSIIFPVYISLSIPLLLDIQVASRSWLLWIVLLWTLLIVL